MACDGCGLHPIIGIRYKCSVCKNFDYCETCEERQSHEHPFLKITKPESAPTVIITAVNEDEVAEHSQDEEVKAEEPAHGHHHRRFGRGGRGGCRGARGRGGFHQFANQMVNMVTRGFMGGFDPQTEGVPAHDEDQFDTGAFGEKRSKWKEQRAIIVTKPQQPVEVRIGQVAFVPIEVLNQTKWPWKHGCYVATSPKQNAALQGIILNTLPVDCEVKGM